LPDPAASERAERQFWRFPKCQNRPVEIPEARLVEVPSRVRRSGAGVRDLGLAAALALLVFVVYPVRYLLTEPYWFDEQWVALSTRMPLSDLPRATWTSPIGFSAALRLIPGAGPERLRIVALLCAAGAVAVAYFLGRELRIIPMGGVITGGAVLLAPMFGPYLELKPYVGDALLSLVMLLMVARLESSWTRKRLVAVGVVGAGGMFVSHPAVFTTLAVMTALLIVGAARRQWQRVKGTAVVAVISLSVVAVEFVLFDRPHQKDSLRQYWSSDFIPVDGGLHGIWDWLDARVLSVTTPLGVRSIVLVMLLAVVGMVTLVKLGRVALALVVPLMVALTMIASAMRRYPFLGLFAARTSLFWLVGVLMLMAIGVMGIVAVLGRRHVMLGAVALVVIAALWVGEVAPDLRRHAIPAESLRQQIEYLEAHQHPGDVVLVNFASAWGYALYSTTTRFKIAEVENPPVGFPDFVPTYPVHGEIVVAQDRDSSHVKASLATAKHRAHQLGSQRIWIVSSHVIPSEARAWRDALSRSNVEIRRKGDPGESLLLLHLPPRPAST
jgi:hypothetical protein